MKPYPDKSPREMLDDVKGLREAELAAHRDESADGDVNRKRAAAAWDEWYAEALRRTIIYR